MTSSNQPNNVKPIHQRHVDLHVKQYDTFKPKRAPSGGMRPVGLRQFDLNHFSPLIPLIPAKAFNPGQRVVQVTSDLKGPACTKGPTGESPCLAPADKKRRISEATTSALNANLLSARGSESSHHQNTERPVSRYTCPRSVWLLGCGCFTLTEKIIEQFRLTACQAPSFFAGSRMLAYPTNVKTKNAAPACHRLDPRKHPSWQWFMAASGAYGKAVRVDSSGLTQKR